jgi:hypothetical protein
MKSAGYEIPMCPMCDAVCIPIVTPGAYQDMLDQFYGQWDGKSRRGARLERCVWVCIGCHKVMGERAKVLVSTLRKLGVRMRHDG